MTRTYLKLTENKLDITTLTELASASNCGAVSVFVGTTRDNFESKTVVQLEYEAYESMAIKALEEVCTRLRDKWPQVENIVIYHRLGVVPVKEASIVIAISSPHRKDAIQATEWCIDNVKKSIPIWKKEIYAQDEAQWKENRESRRFPKISAAEIEEKSKCFIPNYDPQQILIKASTEEINRRIEAFIENKRSEIDRSNVRDFCNLNADPDYQCARIDALLRKRQNSKGHLQVSRVFNPYGRDQMNADYLAKYISPGGIEERLEALEESLDPSACDVTQSMHERLKNLENRMQYLESVSPEYRHFWIKTDDSPPQPEKRKERSLEEIDQIIAEMEKKVAEEKQQQQI